MYDANHYYIVSCKAVKDKQNVAINQFLNSIVNAINEASVNGEFQVIVEKPMLCWNAIQTTLEQKGFKVIETSCPVSSRRGRYTKYSWTISWRQK